MGINSESNIEANLQIGPTTDGMVRLYVAGEGFEVPMDFDPDEAEEIADEIKVGTRALPPDARSSGVSPRDIWGQMKGRPL